MRVLRILIGVPIGIVLYMVWLVWYWGKNYQNNLKTPNKMMKFIMYNISIFKFWFKYIFLKTPIEIESIEIIERFYNATIREKKLINRVKKINNI